MRKSVHPKEMLMQFASLRLVEPILCALSSEGYVEISNDLGLDDVEFEVED